MPVAPTSGVPPLTTLNQPTETHVDMRVTSFAPYYTVDSSETERNFFVHNEQIVLAAVAALFLMVLFILVSVIGIGSRTLFSFV